MSKLHRINDFSPGQTWARTRWNTHGCAKNIDPTYRIARFASSGLREFATAEFAMAANHGGLIQQLVDFLADQGVALLCTVESKRTAGVDLAYNTLR
jgi:hypothetical protein